MVQYLSEKRIMNMTKLKHVLVLLILVLPMFALAPTMVAGPAEILSVSAKVDNALPAQFVEESLRVAVYAEDNTSLPSYATGGVYTSNYQNVVQFLEAKGFTVTELSTQDILDHKLMTAKYDVFVLPDQLPKDAIVNLVKDYWLGGGGILSFHSSIGFLYYHGMIVIEDEGNFGLLDVDPSAHWGYGIVDNITVGARHSVAKEYYVNDKISFSENSTIFDNVYFSGQNGPDYINLLYETVSPINGVGFALDNTQRIGGRIVQLLGNCSIIPTWMNSIIPDSIDWLTAQPKGRILFDLTHYPYYGIDSWDSIYVYQPTLHTSMRNFLVNHTYTVDKLYPSSSGNLTSLNLDTYDIIIIIDPGLNFTAQEVTDFTSWVNSGGSLLAIPDHDDTRNQNMNYLLSNMDIALNLTQDGTNSLVPSGNHPTHEGCSTMSCLAPGSVSLSGSAFPIWEDASGIPVIGGDMHGNGRIIVLADGAILRDGRIEYADNAQALINFANWLSAASADVLVYTDVNPSTQPNYNYYHSELVEALNNLGISFYMTNDIDYLNLSLNAQLWALVISDSNYYTAVVQNEQYLLDHLESGGKLIMRDWQFRNTGHPLWHYLGFESNTTYITTGPPTVYLWDSGHPIFNLPADYGESIINSTNNYFGTDFTHVTLYDNATSIAGITAAPEENMSAIVLGANGRAICNMFSISEYNQDTDDSTYADSFELFVNEIAYLYYDRPTIDHPADVSYMETETGNEITWTPIADAGPWSYVFKVNGTPVESGRWTGGPLIFNVDGVNVSITEYQLTVFDRLGYSISDLVMLNVTEYIEPGPGLPFDPTLLFIIGGAAAAVVIIVIVFMKRGKKE